MPLPTPASIGTATPCPKSPGEGTDMLPSLGRTELRAGPEAGHDAALQMSAFPHSAPTDQNRDHETGAARALPLSHHRGPSTKRPNPLVTSRQAKAADGGNSRRR